MEFVSIQELFAHAMPKLVPEDITWDGKQAKFYFQRLSMEESADLGRPFLNKDGSGIDKEKIKDFQAAILVATIRNEKGETVVLPEAVLKSDSAFYQSVQAAAQKHNPAGSAAVEEAAKKSETTPSSTTS